jgi:hypothetical protein
MIIKIINKFLINRRIKINKFQFIILVYFLFACNIILYSQEIKKSVKEQLLVFKSERESVDSSYSDKFNRYVYIEQNKQKYLDEFPSFRALRDFVIKNETNKLKLLLVNKISPVEFSSFGIIKEEEEVPFAEFCIITIDTSKSNPENTVKIFYNDSLNVIKSIQLHLSKYLCNLFGGSKFTKDIVFKDLPYMFDILLLKIDDMNYQTKFSFARFWRFPPKCDNANLDHYFYKGDSLQLFYLLVELYENGILTNNFGCQDDDYIIRHK